MWSVDCYRHLKMCGSDSRGFAGGLTGRYPFFCRHCCRHLEEEGSDYRAFAGDPTPAACQRGLVVECWECGSRLHEESDRAMMDDRIGDVSVMTTSVMCQ
jgi:hypothetical protein